MRIRRSPLSVFILTAFTLLFVPCTRAAELLSTTLSEKAGKGASSQPSISGDGRMVVFSSLARLLPQDRNGFSDVYLRDRQTGVVRLISDDRGGDQPIISANGRYVAYRSLDAFPKVRFVDLESDEAPRTVSYPFGGGRSFHYADSASISPDGRFVSLALRPIPGFSGRSDPQLIVNETRVTDRLSASDSISDNFLLDTLGRNAMTRDGERFFIETSTAIASFDTNDDQDIYLLDRNDNFVRVSATVPNGHPDLPEEKGARDPVVTASGDAVFFISERRLRLSDEDGRETIYRSRAADGFATPEPVATAVRPLALSRQATSNGEFVVFLGQPDGGASRPYVLRLSDGKLRQLATSALGPDGVAISADNGTITVVTNATLAGRDANGTRDVFVVANPLLGQAIAPPQVNLTAPANGTVISEGSAINLSATATSGNGVFFTALEVDGVEITRAAGGFVQFNGVQLARGIHSVRAVALSQANVPGQSASVQITVRPAANQVRITDVLELKRAERTPGGAVEFTASARVDNTFSAARGPFQLVLTEASTPARWEIFGDEDEVPPREENVLAFVDLPSIAGNDHVVVPLAGLTSAPELIGDGFQGVGWTVLARLRELVNGAWTDVDEVVVLEVRPRLKEETPGPNGGIPDLGSPRTDESFNPNVLQSLQVQGRTRVAERTTSRYRALATFNTGTKPCTPRWAVTTGRDIASISDEGILKLGNVASPRTVTIRATFENQSATLQVTVKPVSPVVSVRAAASAAEGGESGRFKIVCTPPPDEPTEVLFQVGGSATPGDDYTALTGSVTVGKGVASVSVAVTPAADGFFEGRENVVLRLIPSGTYRLGAARSASVVIEDAEAVPADQPDAIIIKDGGSPVGAQVFHFEGDRQQAFARTPRKKPVFFTCVFAHPSDAAPRTVISGAGDFLGFKVRYFVGDQDVTAAVVDETFEFAEGEGGSRELTVRITPTDATPLKARMRCPITANTNGRVDVVEAVVERAR